MTIHLLAGQLQSSLLTNGGTFWPVSWRLYGTVRAAHDAASPRILNLPAPQPSAADTAHASSPWSLGRRTACSDQHLQLQPSGAQSGSSRSTAPWRTLARSDCTTRCLTARFLPAAPPHLTLHLHRSFGAAASAAAAAAANAAAAKCPACTPRLSAAASAAAVSAQPSATADATCGHPKASDGLPTSPPAPLSFSDHRAVFEGQSTWQLLRAYCVLRVCGFKPLVDNAEALLATSRRLLGPSITDAVVKKTFFAHFCAGEYVKEVQRTMDRLRAAGVGAILDYAAEDDVGPTTAAASASATNTISEPPSSSSSATSGPSPALGSSARALGVVGRTYDYASEEQCDRHVDHFLQAIEMAARQPGRPAFAAIKMTALGNPELLQRASTALVTLHGLFARFDEDGSGFIDRGEFQRQWRRLVAGGGAGDAVGSGGVEAGVPPGPAPGTDPLGQQADDTFRWLDTQGSGKVDYVRWCQKLDLRHMPLLAARIHEGGGRREEGSRAVADACLDGQEVELMGALLGRLQRLVTTALQHDVRLMIDAEHTYFQPAIEHVTLQLMRQHNRDGVARVLNTYQAYLKDSRPRLLRDLERSRREGWVLGAKLVRGAYLHLERRRAEALGQPSPVWDTPAETHANYNACVADLLEGVAGRRAEVLLGTHNQPSVEAAVAAMTRLGLPAAAAPGAPGVMFGQLLGMSDHLTLTLGKAGYRAYKYVPYGHVGEVMPYLLRRAVENKDIMKGSKQDLLMLRSELRRRAAAAVGLA